ncbi:MAG: SAM-dependent methyltransferase, partial [Bacteroidales bacterium]|nr:SAM-dependent methyltransferase [Bacteroidales bacterium]
MNYIDINKNLWNQKTEIHYNSDFYDVDSFIKGKDSLNPIEIGLLGQIKGKKILHLQCHFGLDTIS